MLQDASYKNLVLLAGHSYSSRQMWPTAIFRESKTTQSLPNTKSLNRTALKHGHNP